MPIGLAKVAADPEATARTRRNWARLGDPTFVVTGNGIFINTNGLLALKPGTDMTPYKAVTATYTITETDSTIDCDGTFTVTLPTAVGSAGRVFVVKNSGVGVITLDGDGAELIDGAATVTLNAGDVSRVQSTSTGWILI